MNEKKRIAAGIGLWAVMAFAFQVAAAVPAVPALDAKADQASLQASALDQDTSVSPEAATPAIVPAAHASDPSTGNPASTIAPSTPAPSTGLSASAKAAPDSSARAFDLDKVTVTAGARKFSRKGSEQVARMPLANLENPQAYTVVPKELTEEQLAVDYKSAFKNVPGSGPASYALNGRTFFTARGFTSGNLIRNGMVTWAYSDIDPINIERIEAIRGPSGTLFGSAGQVTYGGVFNRVTKRPFETFQGEVSYTGGAWNLSRLTADVNMPLNPEKTALLRVNAASHGENSFQDAGFSRSIAVAPSFSYQASRNLSILLDAEWYDRQATPTAWFTPSGIKNVNSADQLYKSYYRSFTSNSLSGKMPTYNLFGQVNYRLPAGWSSQTHYAFSRNNLDINGIYALTGLNDSMATRSQIEQHLQMNSHQVQQNFTGEFKVGPVRNRVLLGLDYNNGNFGNTQTLGVFDTVNFQEPGAKYTNATVFTVDRKAETLPLIATLSESHTYSAYASDVLNPIDRISILLGLRVDKFDNRGTENLRTGVTTGVYEQMAYSPKVGVVYQAVEDQLSLFANYLNGFTNVDGSDFQGKEFTPEQANQWEAGLKAETFQGKLVGTLSYYDITVDDKVRPDVDHAGFSVQDGQQSSRGVEMEVSANPISGLYLVAGYAYNDSWMEKAAANVNGRRPIGSGPENAANLWISYRLTRGAMKGLGLGFGANHVGEQFVVNTTAQEFTVPEFTAWDGTVYYDHPAYRLGLKVDNLTDERYWNTNLIPQAPRRILGSVAYKF